MRKLNSVGLMVTLALCLSVTGVYAADKATVAKPQAAEATAAAKVAATVTKAAPKAEATKAAEADAAQALQAMEAQIEQLHQEEIRREIRKIQEGGRAGGPRRDPNEEPIAIHNIQELQRIGNDENYPLDGTYLLVADIDASETRDWNNGQGFMPIGNYFHPFIGSFNGDGHTITNLTINRENTNYIGLFGYIGSSWGNFVPGVVVSNIKMDNVNMRGRDWVGGLAGGNTAGSIVSSSSATGSIRGRDNVGGLVGVNTRDATIANSYATGSVTGRINAGGLLGDNLSRAVVTDSYATGNVSGEDDVGGLVGQNEFQGAISNCYAAGRVESVGGYRGGLVGTSWNTPAENYSNNYFDRETTGRDNGIGHGDGIAGIQGRTTAQMMQQDTFEGWDFEGIWYIDEGESYPRHRWELPPVAEQTINLQRGHNYISFYVLPANLRMMDIVRPLIEAGVLEWVVDEAGRHIVNVPTFGLVDTGIENISAREGYYIKVANDATLTIEGTPVELPLTIPLRQGWNIMGYPVSQAQPAMDVLQQLVDAGVAFGVKDSQGRFILNVNGRIFNNLGNFQPGQGYQILVDRDVDLVVNAP